MMLIQIAGRLGRDPESRFTPSGQKVTTFNVAVNIRKGKEETTVWWRVTVWGDRFDKMLTYLKKGSAVIVVGEMQKPEIWTDKNGQPQVSLDMTAEMIKFSPFGNPDQQRQEQSGNAATAQTGYAPANKTHADSYGDSGNGNAAGGYSSPNSTFGSFQEASPARYGQADPQHEEEPLPF